jgi:hypothetical protein
MEEANFLTKYGSKVYVIHRCGHAGSCVAAPQVCRLSTGFGLCFVFSEPDQASTIFRAQGCMHVTACYALRAYSQMVASFLYQVAELGIAWLASRWHGESAASC